ncbi:MAG: glycosyltransferase family 4 protein [Acidimicrobiales bacterium]
MRVGLVCPYSLSLPGGVQGQVLGLGRALRRMGVEARVLGPCDGPPPEPAVTPLGNSIPTVANGSIVPLAPDPAATLRTVRALRDEAFDVVHIHEPLVPGPPLTALIFTDQPKVGTFHRAGRDWWYRAVRPLASWAISWLAVRAAVSEQARDGVNWAFPGQYELVWNGIDVDEFAGAEPWPSAGPTILFLGRHEPRKGLDVLVEAVRRLDPGVRLWIGSEGPDTARLRRATSGDERFEWLGVISEREKARRIRGASVLCAPSLHGESFGVVLLEGFAARTPVVASDIVGYRNVATPEKDARLVPPGDPAVLAAALGEALAGGVDIDAMVDRAEERARVFSMDHLAKRYLELYERAKRAAPPGRH